MPGRIKTTPFVVSHKEAELRVSSDKIASDLEEFLKRGNKIEKIPMGMGAIDYSKPADKPSGC